MFCAGYTQFMHVTVVPNHIGREFSLLLYQNVEHHSQHGEAKEDYGDNKDL